MKRTILAVGLMALLLFGCVQEPPPAEPPAPEPTMTCDEYCRDQPHAACVGSWKISGTYPDCTCNWECEVEPPPTMANPAAVSCDDKGYEYDLRDSTGYCSHGGLECEEWALYRMECCLQDPDCSDKECSLGTATCLDQVCTCPEPEVDPPVATEKGIEGLLEDGLGVVNDQFYSDIETGTFEIKTYTWINTAENDPDVIPIGNAGIEGDMLFSGQVQDDIVGFGFKTFVQSDGPHSEARGLAIFAGDSSVLKHASEDGGTIDIFYAPPSPGRHMLDCTISGPDNYMQLDHNNRLLKVYHFICMEVVEEEYVAE